MTTLSHRDRAILRAVAAGRCALSGDVGVALVVDGVGLADQFAAPRLVQAGLIDAAASKRGPVRLTESGRALLEAA
jgi:hypothetical protein